MVTRKGRIKNAFRSAVLSATILISGTAFCYPLRVWVMPNEPAINEPARPAGEITAFINDLKETHGIVIENGVQDFLQPGNVDYALPIVSNIIGSNQFIEELKDFKNKERTDEPISVRFIRWSDAFDRLTAAVSSMPVDQQPDVVQIGSTWVASFARDGAIEDLSGKFAENDFFKPAIDSAHPAGIEGLYAVPWFLDTRLFYYNKDMISADTIADWEKLKNECPRILAQNPKLKGVVGIQIAMTWNLLHNLAPQLWAFGGDMIGARFVGPLPVHDVLLDDPGSVAAIKFLRDLSAERCLYFEDVNAETMEQRFLNKEVAAITQVSQFIHRLPAGWEKDFGISLPPAGPSGSVPFVGGSHLALWHTAKDRKNSGRALSLISFLTGEGSQERFIPATGFLPARRHVLNTHFEFPSLAVFVNALDKGRSYPAIAEWGPVVENEFIRGHIWNIWHGIAQAEPMEVIEGSIKNAAASLRKKVALNIFDKNKYKGLFALGLLIGIGSILFVRSRRKYHFLESQLERTRQELNNVNGERTAIEGQLLLQERKEKSRSRHLGSLKERLQRINERSRSLTKQLASFEIRHREAVRPLIGNIKISWNGKISTETSEIAFENAVQAHRLIEHLTRLAANGITSVSCLWGYALFGWDTGKLKSQPNRLFNTAVAKINSALMDGGRPAILRSEGRKSWRWRVLWNSELLLKGSDVAAAMEHVAMAQAAKERGELDKAATHTVQALGTDPKCIDAAGLVCHLPYKAGSELEKLKNDTAALLEKDISELERGTKEIERLMTDEFLEYKELMEREAAAMRHLAGHLSRCVENLGVKARADRQPLHLADILCRLSSIQTDITTLRASGIAEKGVWATIVHDEKFVGLISIPKVQSLVNRFYNHETKTVEDPRLVQLALVLMLSKPEHMTSFENATTDDEFFGGFEKQLQRQFRALEQHISLLPPQ